MIDGVKVKKLKIIPDERGRLMEILRSDDEAFKKFGQVYMTTAKPGIAKAWHYHKKQDDNFTCVCGRMKLALYDARAGSPTYKRIYYKLRGTDTRYHTETCLSRLQMHKRYRSDRDKYSDRNIQLQEAR